MKENLFSELSRKFPEIFFKENFPAKNFTSFKSGGSAAACAYPAAVKEFTALLKYLHEKRKKYVIIGNGSNVLFPDAGFKGAAVVTKNVKGIEYDGEQLILGAGVTTAEISGFCMKRGISGLEFLSGIPATAGGAAYMNAGAFSEEVSKHFLFCDVYDIDNDKVIRLNNSDMKFSHRSSSLHRGGTAILSVGFAVGKSDPLKVREKIAKNIKIRLNSQPRQPSCGSAFKREDGIIPALLIDRAGLKGLRAGGAEVSSVHSGFIINAGFASTDDYRTLASEVMKRVMEIFNVEMKYEVIFIE